MAISAFGGWRFGWSLGIDTTDRVWHAFLYAGADVAAGALVVQGAIMLRGGGWGILSGIVALVPALILVLISILSTFGVMSGRIAVLAGQEKIEAMDVADNTWLKSQILNEKLPLSERKTFLAEQRKAAREAKEAAANITDKQAVGLSKAAKALGFNVSVSSAQLVLTGLSSTLPMTIQFVCLGIGFYARAGRSSGSTGSLRNPDVGSADIDEPSTRRFKLVQGGKGHKKPHAARDKCSEEEFLARVKREFERGEDGASTWKIARETGWGQSSVMRARKRLRDEVSEAVGRYAGNGSHFPIAAH